MERFHSTEHSILPSSWRTSSLALLLLLLLSLLLSGMASAPASPSSSARLSAVLDQVQLIGIPGEPLDAVLDSVRAQLDALSPAEVASIAVMLLDGKSEANVPSRKERCRLISYSAIIHGRGLYPHLPPLLRSLVSCLDSTEEVCAPALHILLPPCGRLL